MKRAYVTDGQKRYDLLVHESVHAWQFQHAGPRYAAEALWAQWRLGLARAYDWQREIADGRAEWMDFNREAPAQFIQDLYLQEPPAEHQERAQRALALLRGSGSAS